MTLDPTLTPLLDILASLPKDALIHIYNNMSRTDDAPLDKALFAWRDAGCLREKALTAGELVTKENVGALPVGTVVSWEYDGVRHTAERTGPDQWRCRLLRMWDSAVCDGKTFIVSVPA